MPSRHTIDGEQFDLELNIYHGSFNENLGYSAHYHYHHDTDELGVEYHQHIHYHKEGLQGTKDAAHSWGSNKEGLDRDNLNKKEKIGKIQFYVYYLIEEIIKEQELIHSLTNSFILINLISNFSSKDDKYEYEKIKTNKHFSFDDLLPKDVHFLIMKQDKYMMIIILNF